MTTDDKIVDAISEFITNNNRPCPTDHLTKKFGEIVIEMLPAIKKEGKLVGMRGRNGGLMIPGMESMVKRKTPPGEAKKPAVEAPAAPTVEVSKVEMPDDDFNFAQDFA